ncbi:MAG: hypothetical protein ACFCUH_07480 [Flavobacteriales bacterium]|jgi:hypothetical protein
MTASEFKQFSKEQRYLIVRDRSVFLASRMHNGYQVGLYRLDALYVEVWKRVGLDCIDFIEPVDEPRVRDAYLDGLDLPL